MLTIRPFCNADLPGLFDVWIRHWQAARYQVNLSLAALERAALSRVFFNPKQLLVAADDDRIVAWSHRFVSDRDDSEIRRATIAAFCFADEGGLAACDDLLVHTENACRDEGVDEVRVGLVRDDVFGYVGIDPIGHGIGVPTADARTASMLSRHGYQIAGGYEKLTASTSTYRVRASRDFLQLRRQTRVDVQPVIPQSEPCAIALSHIDIEKHHLVNHLRREQVAALGLWLSDVEGQVMDGSRAILAIPQSPLSLEERFLISVVVPSLATRNVYSVETSVDDNQSELVNQLKELSFTSVEQGRQWIKKLD